MGKYKAKEVKELSEYVKAGKIIMGPKHKQGERCAIFDPVTNELITDENKILSTTLK